MKKTLRPQPAAPVIISVAAVVLSTLGPAGARLQDSPRRSAKAFTLTEASLGKTQLGFVEYTLMVSPDGNHIAYVVKQGATKAVVLDGRIGKAYPDIPEQPPTERGRDPEIKFSPDGKRLAYVASSPAGDFVVVDGIEGPPFENISAGAPVFSPDSKRVAYIAGRDGKQTVVVDGIQGPPCSYVAAVPIRFSPDSKHIAYPARRGDSTVAVMDGKDIDRGQQIGFIRFSNDGRRYAYTVLNGETRRVVVDGVSSRLYGQLGNDVFFSADSKHVLYRATGAGGDFIVFDGQEGKYRGIIQENDYEFSPGGKPVYMVDRGPGEIYVVIGHDVFGPYDRVLGMPTFSPDGSRFAFAVRHDSGKYAVVTDGAQGPRFDQIDTLDFSPGRNRLFYTATRGKKHYASLDSVQTEYDAVATSAFSPDGEHLALSVQLGGHWLISKDATTTSSCDSDVSRLSLGPGGKPLAFVCRQAERQFAVIDGVQGKIYDHIGQIDFTSGGAAVYTATLNSKQVVVVGSNELAEFDSLITSLKFDSPSSLHFLAIRDGEFFREEIKFEK